MLARKTFWMLLAITAFALILRLVFIVEWQGTPYAGIPYLDAKAYDDWAQKILSGHWLSDRAFYQSPLFPYLLALLYAVTGHSFLNVALFNALLGAASCGLLAYAALRVFNARAAWLTGLLAALYAPSLFYTVPVLKETLGFFLLSAYLVTFLLALETGKRRYYALTGIFLGLAILTRGNALFLLAAAPFFALRKGHKAGCAAYILGAFLAIAPVTLHNAVVSHDFVPITYSNGFNFFIGNREGSNGANAYPSGIPTNEREESGTTDIAQNMEGRPLKPSEVSAFWIGKGVDFITLHPLEAASLWARKAVLFLSNTEYSDNYNVDFFRREMHSFLSSPVFPGFAVLLALSVFAYSASGKERRRAMLPFLLLAGLYMASVLPFYVTDRYRLPVVVFLLPLAGAAALPAFSKTKRLAVAGLIALIVFAGSTLYPPKNPVYMMAGWLALGDMQLKRGQEHEGAENISRAISMAPSIVEAYWYVKAAIAFDHVGQHEKALALVKAALTQHPQETAEIHAHYPGK